MSNKYCLFCIVFLINIWTVCAQNKSMAESWADSTMSKMSMDERIGQLFMIYAYSNKDETENQTRLSEITQYHVGGVLFMQGTPENQVALTNRFQAASQIPLFIGIDGEWGLSMRLQNTISYPRQMALGAIQNEEMIYRFGLQVGREMRRMGIHINFAPDVDVNTNPLNPVINTRSFGENSRDVARKGIYYMRGLQDAGLIAVAKHFPGHGNTSVDSHLGLPLVNHTREQLEQDLYPFRKTIDAGIDGVMIGHLWVPALDSAKRASSLSYKIVTTLLRDSMKFQGLAFTDGMGMGGVKVNCDSAYRDVLLAGNDVILFPPNIKAAFEEVQNALKVGTITEDIINLHCKRILVSKYEHGLSVPQTVLPDGVGPFVNGAEGNALNENLVQQSITLLKNRQQWLPFSNKALSAGQTIISIGGKKGNVFEKTCLFYRDATFLRYAQSPSDANIKEALTSAAGDSVVVVAIYSNSKDGATAVTKNTLRLIDALSVKSKVVVCMFTNPYSVSQLKDVEPKIQALVVGYSTSDWAQQSVVEVLYGGAACNGIMPVSTLDNYPCGTSERTSKIRMGISAPETQGMSSDALKRIDTLVKEGIDARAMPGCQVLVARHGVVVFNKSYGYYTYDKKHPVDNSNLYDLASVTKVTATLPAVMHLIETHAIALSDTLGSFFKEMQNTDKANITIEQLLRHESGFPAFIPMVNYFIDESKLGGMPLYSNKKSDIYTFTVDRNFYGNKQRAFSSTLFSQDSTKGFTLRVAAKLFAKPTVRDTIWNAIVNAPLHEKKYLYSDLNFMILQRIVELKTSETLDVYAKKEVYKSLNGGRTTFCPRRKFSVSRMAPTEDDEFFRKQLLQGDVHDLNAALMGGVSGHAGLFSSASDLAKLMQMYLNGGSYGGKQYLKPETVALFSETRKGDSRRGLGFDKPELDKKKINPVADECTANSYGHTGFTGTLVWVDPDFDLVYIFLSNRVYPEAFNRKLISMGIRTEIQKTIYQSIREGHDIALDQRYMFAPQLVGVKKAQIEGPSVPQYQFQPLPEKAEQPNKTAKKARKHRLW